MKHTRTFPIFQWLLIVGSIAFIMPCTLAQNSATKPSATVRQSPTTPSPIPADQLSAKARYYGDSVVLRWSPANAQGWQRANQTGYRISRFEIDEKAGKVLDIQLLTSTPLKPWTIEEWKSRSARTDSLAGISVQILYGKSTPDPTGELGQAVDAQMDADNRFLIANVISSWSARHAIGLAMRFSDATVKPNRSYVYAISLDAKAAAPGDTTYLMVRTDQIESRPDMPEIQYEPADRVVVFRWDRRFGSQRYTGYHYERSDDGGRTFKRLNRKPYVNIASRNDSLQHDVVLIDSLPRNYVKYQYRIVGITPFADLGNYSPLMPVMGIDLTPPGAASPVTGTNLPGTNTVKLTWQKNTLEPDFIGFVVGRSTSSAGPFTPLSTKLLGKEIREFTDETAAEFGTNFYVVSAVDTAGNASVSLPTYVAMHDRGAPAQPTALAGSIDSTGRVTLNWKRNAEPDLLGYFVYVANAPDHAFTPLTPDFLADEYFSDSITLRTLSEKIYYRVVAFDKSRRASPCSEILELKKPDRVPPVSPVFDHFLVADSSVTLHWARSSSEDVVSQLLYRKEEGKDADYVLLTKLDKAQAEYRDRSVLPRRGYAYVLLTVDDAQNQSPRSFPQRVRTFDSGVRNGVKDLAVDAPAGQPVMLRWNGAGAQSGRVLVYRKIDTQPLRLIDNVPGSQQTYQDALSKKGVYQYAVKTIYPDGGESPMSSFVRVTR